MEYMLIDDGLFLSSSVDVGLVTASRVKANGGIVSLPDVKIFQEASSFLKFSLRFSAHSDIDGNASSTGTQTFNCGEITALVELICIQHSHLLCE